MRSPEKKEPKVVILAGGLGTRLAEETTVKPKPMVEIGGYPMLWHIMNIYAHFNYKQFVVALGYKGHMIKDYFIHYHLRQNDITVDLQSGEIDSKGVGDKDWTVQLVDTGQDTLTGGRLHRLQNQMDSTFMMTYGDGVSNIDIEALMTFHQSHGKIATVSAVRPAARFGTMKFEGNQVTEFHEKPQTGEGWINGGFFVFEPAVFNYLKGDSTVLERDPLERLAEDGELMAYKHDGFWQCMDTLRDKNELEMMWQKETPPWKIWDNTAPQT